MIMTMEGLMSESLEDAYGVLPTTDADEFPVDAEDEAYYVDVILSGIHDEAEGEYAEGLSEFMHEYPSDRECDYAEDRATRAYFGD